MPDDVIGEANDIVSSTLGHLGKAFGLSLVFKGIAWEVDACKAC